MFGSRLVAVGVALALLVAVVLGAARPSVGATPTARYTVKPGDTLWTIAESHTAGDPREAIWELRRSNGLDDATLTPGQVILVPR